jgi:CubicO group peptidase (beta-lactamase class C family)
MRTTFLRARLAVPLVVAAALACARQPRPAVGASGVAIAAPPVAAAATTAVFPAAEWERLARPEDAGWPSADLDTVRARLSRLSTTGFMAVVGGKVLMEYGDVKLVSYLASVRKSILAMLYGNHVANGTIRLGKTLAELGIDDHGGLTAAEREATILDLITARSGVYHAASNSGDDLASAPPRGSQRHGTYMLYSNWDFNAAGTAFERETGRNIYDALESDLARPIGMQDFNRAIHRRTGDSTKSVHLAYHMNLSTRDMARVGYLMLREGNWAGRQLVPRDWVRTISRAYTPVTDMNPPQRRNGPFGYGYLWWVWDGPHATGAYRGAYTGLGAVGQQITVIPVLDLVVVHKTQPGQGRSVSHGQYLEVLDILVKAGCKARTC